MKLYVVIGGWEYEGYSEPTGIYSTREKADAAVEHASVNHSYNDLDVLEYELDVGEREDELARRKDA
jgi:hypothetical protein